MNSNTFESKISKPQRTCLKWWTLRVCHCVLMLYSRTVDPILCRLFPSRVCPLIGTEFDKTSLSWKTSRANTLDKESYSVVKTLVRRSWETRAGYFHFSTLASSLPWTTTTVSALGMFNVLSVCDNQKPPFHSRAMHVYVRLESMVENIAMLRMPSDVCCDPAFRGEIDVRNNFIASKKWDLESPQSLKLSLRTGLQTLNF